jgi:SAM-dependent methyltransferase
MDDSLYDELWQVERSHWWFRARRKIVWSLVHRYLKGASWRRLRVCELGCGTGGNIAAMADRHDVIGIEPSPKGLAYARRCLGQCVYSGALPNDIRLPPDSFDVVLLADVLEHIQDHQRSAQVALRLLRPGGLVVATVPAYQWLYAPRDAYHGHFRRYGKTQFRKLWTMPEAQIMLLSHYNTLLFVPAAVARLASKLSGRASQPTDLRIPPRPLNDCLELTMRSESHLLGRVPLPFGLSLVAVVRKREAPAVKAAA